MRLRCRRTIIWICSSRKCGSAQAASTEFGARSVSVKLVKFPQRRLTMRAALVTVMILFMNCYQLRISAAGNSNETLYKENLKRCQAFRCGTPQPHVLRYQDLFHSNEVNPCEVSFKKLKKKQRIFLLLFNFILQDVHPHVAVLHRCDSTTGYCSSSVKSSCGPIHLEEVSIGFMITLKHSSGGCITMPKQIRYVQVTAINHTQCACTKKDDIK